MMTETSNDDKIEILPPGATRKKVKHACYQCKMAHAACDIQRPCKRCISMGLAGDCRDPDPKKRARNVTPLVQRRIQNSWPEDQRPIRQEEKRLRFSSPMNFEDLGSHDLGLIESRLNDWSTENGMYTHGPTPIKNEQIDPDIVISEAPASTATPMESTSSNGLAATNLFYPTTTTTTTGFSHSKPQPIPGRSPRAKSPRGSPKNNVTFPTPSFLSQQPPLSQSHPPPASPAPFNPLSTTPTNNTPTSTTTQKRTPPTRTFSFDQFPSGGGNAFKPPAPVSPMVPSDDLSEAEKTTTSILQTILSELKEVKQSHHELMKEQQALRGEIMHLQSSPPTTPTSPPGLYPGFATPPTTSTSSTAPGFGPPEGGFNFGSARDNGSPQSPIFIPNSPSLSTAGFTPPASPAFNLSSHTSQQQGNSFFSGFLPQQQDNNKNPDNIALFSPVSRPMTSSPNNNTTTTTTTSTALGFPENSGVMHFPIKNTGGGAPRDPSKTIPYWRPTNLPTIHAPRRATAPFKAASLPSTVPTPSNHRFRSTFEGGFGAFDLPSTAPSSPSPFSSVHSVDIPLNPQTAKGASNPHLSNRPPTTTPPSSSSTTATTSTSSTSGVPNRTPFAIEDPTKPFAILARNGADVVFTMVNDPFCRLYNYQRNELIGKSWRMVLPNTQQDICEGFFRRLLAKRSPGPASEIMSVSLPNQTKDGIIFDTRSRHQIFYDDAGHLSWNIVYIESHSLPTPDQFLSVFQEPTPSPSPLSSSSLSTPIPTSSTTSTTPSIAYPSPISASFPPSPGYSNLFTPDSNPYSPLDSYLQPATPFMTNALPTGDTSSPHTPFGLPDLNQYQNGNGGSSASSSTDISDYFNQSLTPFISFDSVPMENTDNNNNKPNSLLSELTEQEGRNRKEEVDSFGCLQELLQFEPLKKEESSDGMNLPASSENKKDGNDGNGFGEEQQQQQMEGKEYGAANDEEVDKEFEDMMRDSTDGSFGVFFSDENLTKDI